MRSVPPMSRASCGWPVTVTASLKVALTVITSSVVYAPASPGLEVIAITGPVSAMETVDAAVVPALTPVGSEAPKPSSTLSPSSMTMSAVAVNVNVFEVSPEANSTLDGTPE